MVREKNPTKRGGRGETRTRMHTVDEEVQAPPPIFRKQRIRRVNQYIDSQHSELQPRMKIAPRS